MVLDHHVRNGIGIGIRLDVLDFFRHDFFGARRQQFLKCFFILSVAAVVKAGSQNIDVLRYVRAHFFVQEIPFGNNPEQFVIIADNGNRRYLIADK